MKMVGDVELRSRPSSPCLRRKKSKRLQEPLDLGSRPVQEVTRRLAHAVAIWEVEVEVVELEELGAHLVDARRALAG
jgi:hypothetical protein